MPPMLPAASVVFVLPMLTLGILADTHVPYRLPALPLRVFEALYGVDLILHAGDVDRPEALEPLRALAPVHAVRGNWHLGDLSDGGAALPAHVELSLEGHCLVLVHGHRPGVLGFLHKLQTVLALWVHLTDNTATNRRISRDLAKRFPQADIVVFGHSHLAHLEIYRGTLFVNPGGVYTIARGGPTVARMVLGDGPPRVSFVSLRGDGQAGSTG